MTLSRAESIFGWMTKTELTWLAEQAEKAKIIVEFGSFKGRSTRALADNTNGIVYAVDPWDGIYYNEKGDFVGLFAPSNFADFFGNLSDHIYTGRVVPCRIKSLDFSIPSDVDFLFIDGDHRYPTVIADIMKGQSMVRKGGIISGHDYTHADWPGVKRAVDEIYGDKIQRIESIWWVNA